MTDDITSPRRAALWNSYLKPDRQLRNRPVCRRGARHERYVEVRLG